MAMKPTVTLCFVSFLTLFSIINGEKVRAAARSEGEDCTSALMSMMDCLTFIESGSTTAKPESSCCSGLAQVVKSNVRCLCQTFSLSAGMGITLDNNKTLSLPSACHIKTPPFSQCNISLPGVGVPSQAPNASPDVPSSELPSEARAPVIVGEAGPILAPSPDLLIENSPNISNGVQLKISPFMFTIGLVVVMLSYHYIIY